MFSLNDASKYALNIIWHFLPVKNFIFKRKILLIVLNVSKAFSLQFTQESERNNFKVYEIQMKEKIQNKYLKSSHTYI